MKEILMRLFKSCVIIVVAFFIGQGILLFNFYFILEHSNRDPITESLSKTSSDGKIISERFIKGTSIKHGITKIFDANHHLEAVINYYYGKELEKVILKKKMKIYIDTFMRNGQIVDHLPKIDF